MADMIKFFKGSVASLPASGANGAIYITTDEGGIYLGTGTGMKRLGDFIQVDAVANLPTAGANTSALYYCVAENVLAKWNGSEWIQINKQRTKDELVTLLGLGGLAYKSEVAEGDLSAALAEKVNAAAEGNHSHSNKGVLDGISAEKVAAWDKAEENAKAHADGLDAAMNTRVEALEAIDHTHANKALLDTYTQTESDLADAVAKKHSHTFNETELNKIVEGDKAKWDAVAADHLTSADKTTLENAIKEAKKAGTDANTALEAYKVTNDAAIDAIEEDIAEITDGTNGILAQAKGYSDGKLATARTEISAEIDADVKVVADDLAGYKSSNDTALAGVKATADAAAAKTYVDEELGKKVDKVTGKSLVSDTEIAKLATVSEGAKKVEASTTNGSIKIDGVDTVVYTHPEKHAIADVDGLQTVIDDAAEALLSEVGLRQSRDNALSDRITVLEGLAGNSSVKDQIEGVVGKVDEGSTIVGMIEAVAGDLDAHLEEAEDTFETKTDASAKLTEAKGYTDTEVAKVQGAIDGHISEANGKFETKTDAAGKLTEAKGYTDTEVAKVQGAIDDLEELVGTLPEGTSATTVVAYIDAKTANIASDETVGAIADRVKAIEDDYLKGADKTELAGLITAEETRAKGIEEGLQNQINLIMNNPDTEKVINSISEFTQYIEDHGEIAEGLRTDIDQNKADIAAINNASTGILKQAKDYADGLADNYAAAEHDHVVADITDFESAVATKVESYGYATTGYADGKASAAQSAAEATAAGALASAKTELEGKITSGDSSTLSAAKAYTDELANGQVKTNKEAIAANVTEIAKKANATDVYTKAEVEELLTWGSF